MKSPKRWAAACVLGLVVGGVCYFPYARVSPRSGEHQGIDVSGHQGRIDWEQIKASGQEFAYIKATEGGDWVDDTFVANWEGCGRVGMRRGAYHFFTLQRPGSDQAANFRKTVPNDPSALPPVVDLEFSGNSPRRPERAKLIAELGTFLRFVETEKPVIFYVTNEFENYYHVTRDFPRKIWVQQPLIRPGDDSWEMWQFNQFGKLSGISGHVDLDLMRY